MHFTLWPSLTSNQGTHREITWESFLAFVASPQTAEVKERLEGWSPARFKDNRRGKAYVEAVSCMVLDDDESGLPFERARSLWSSFAGVIHTSFSHTPEAPRHRIVLRCSRDITATEYAHVRRWFGNVAKLDERAKDASRLWFLPARREGAPYEWAELKGEVVDVDRVLAIKFDEPAPAPALSSTPAPAGDRRRALALALGAAWPAKGRHEAQLALAGALRGQGWAEADALEFLCAVCRAAGDENRPKREATIRHTWAQPEGAALTGWTRLKTHVDPVLVDAARGALAPDADSMAEVRNRLAGPTPVADAPPPEGVVKTSRFTFETAGLDAPLPPLDYQIEGLICRAEVVMFVAHGNSLKTWLAFSLALAVASGQDWLGKFKTQKGRACIIDFESGKYEVVRRLQLLGAKGVEDRLLRTSYPVARLAEIDAWAELATLDLDFIIVDSFNAATPEIDENDARSALILQHAGRFAEMSRCTCLFVHHSRKGSGGDRREAVRGSTAIFAACDRIFEFIDIEKKDGGIVEATMAPMKDGAGRRPADVRVQLSDSGLKYIDVAKEPVQDENERRKAQVLSILREHPSGVNKPDLLNMLKGAIADRRKTVSELLLGGVIVEFREGKRLVVMLNPADQ